MVSPDHPRLRLPSGTLWYPPRHYAAASANSPRASRWNGIEVPGIIQLVIGLSHRPFTV
jgi:hypothetical protein